ncbi:MAG: nucleotidyltransferase [Phycisphaeraceae bacterium]|nr:MAG: nucleotidyltransferase [Phycisphaeraceae bacterium]
MNPAIENELKSHPHPLLFVTVSGAHLYGFESHDSDWDLRGAHVASMQDVLSLKPGPETYERMGENGGVEIDFVTHDARKFFIMLLKCNGYALEQVFSPLVAAATPEFEELRDIASRCICRQHRHHFFHFGVDQWKLTTGKSEPTVKGLLYTYRPLMAGIHLMRAGRVESNLRRLNEDFRIPEVDALIDRKLAGDEKGTIDAAEAARHQPVFDRLCAELDAAREASHLPDQPAGREALNDLLIRLRLRAGDTG